MGTITMHGVDEAVERRVREIARKEKASINRTVQALLRQALGFDDPIADHREEFEDIIGCWSKSDLAEFEAATESLSKIDPEDWK